MLFNRPSRSPAARLATRLSIEALDDRIVPAKLSVSDVPVVACAGTTERALVRVTLDAASRQTVTVNYATADGIAKAGSDYIAVSGTLFFSPGETSKQIDVPILSDTEAGRETFFFDLKDARYARILDGRGVITILDDRPCAHVSETLLSASIAQFTVSLSTAYDQPVTVAYATANFPNSQFAPLISGALTFAPGETTKSFTANVYPVPAGTNDAFLINLSITYADGVVVNSWAYGHVSQYELPPVPPDPGW